MGLYEDVVATLQGYVAGDAQQSSQKDRFLDLLATGPEVVRADHPGGHITASVLVVSDSLDQVLLCLHGKVKRWMQFGGHLEEHDETLAAAGLREATEESGIPGLIVHPVPIHLDVHPVTCRTGPSHHYDVRFAALAPAGASEVISDESLALGWFPPDALPEPLASATAQLMRPGLTVASVLKRQAATG